jgi:hypothetical protein
MIERPNFIQPVFIIVLITFLAISSGCLKYVDTGLTEERIEGEITPGFPHPWRLFGRIDGKPASSYYGGIESQIYRSGEKCVSFLAVAVTSKNQARLTQRFYADTFRGKRVQFSGYLKTNRVLERAGLWMRVDTETKQAYAFDDMENRAISGTVDWTICEVVLDVPEDAAAIYLGAHLIGRGQVWIDDCSFEIVDDSVPTTDQDRMLGGYQRRFSVPKFLPDAPLNLDFEQEGEEVIMDELDPDKK